MRGTLPLVRLDRVARVLGSGAWGGVSRDAAAAAAAALTGTDARRPLSPALEFRFVVGLLQHDVLGLVDRLDVELDLDLDRRVPRKSAPEPGSAPKPGSGGITRVSSDSKCQGRRSTSLRSSGCSPRSAPTAGRSSESMEGSKASSWASQSVSSSRHMGGATAASSPVLVSRMAGTCPVGASFQWGISGCSSTTGPVTSRTVSPAGSAPMMRTRPEW